MSAEAENIYIGYRDGKGKPSSPHDWQDEFHEAAEALIILIGGLFSGKTGSIIKECIKKSCTQKNNLSVILRLTKELLRDTTRKDFLETADPIPHHWDQQLNDYTFTRNNSMVLFRSLVGQYGRDIEDRLGSYQCGYIAVDEGNVLRPNELSYLQGRLGRKGIECPQMVVAMNPVFSPNHYLAKLIAKGNTRDVRIIHSNTYQNREFVPEGYIERYERTHTPEEVKRFLAGEICYITEGQAVYSVFQNLIHGADKTPYIESKPVYRGIDWAFHHPAIVFAQLNVRDQLVVQHEYMGDKMTNEEFCGIASYLSGSKKIDDLDSKLQRLIENTELKPFYPKEARFEDFCDPAGASEEDPNAPVNVARKTVGGVPLYNIFPHFRKSEIIEGVQLIRDLLNIRSDGVPGITVNRQNCPTLLQGFLGGYQLKQRGEMIIDEPVKDGWYDHLQDGLRYMVLFLFSQIKRKKEVLHIPRREEYDFGKVAPY